MTVRTEARTPLRRSASVLALHLDKGSDLGCKIKFCVQEADFLGAFTLQISYTPLYAQTLLSLQPELYLRIF